MCSYPLSAKFQGQNWMETDQNVSMENGTCNGSVYRESISDLRKSGGSSLLFLGTGCSSAVPNAMCLIQPSDPPCQILDAVKRICPKRDLFFGMTVEFDHHKDNEELTKWSKREGIPVQLAHDGLRIFIDL